MIVYVITSGIYSDYGIECVCSTLEKAQEVVAAHADCSIEPYELDDYTTPPQGMKRYMVYMRANGDVESVQPTLWGIRSKPEHIELWFRKEAKCVSLTAMHDMVCTCWARNHGHAVKIANEQRIMAIAGGRL